MEENRDAKRWDGVAHQFNDLRVPVWGEDLFLKTLSKIPVWDVGANVMDLGCGAGRYSIAVSDRCGKVTGSDISPKMIEFANRKKEEFSKDNITFVNESWHDIDIKERGYEKSFDLIFAHMTPAFETTADLEKANKASRGYVALATFARRDAPMAEKFYDFLGIESKWNRKDKIPEFFDYLYENKHFPSVNYYLRDDTQEFSEEDAVRFLRDRFVLDSAKDADEEIGEKIRDFVRRESKGGVFVNTVNAVIVTMWWKTQEAEYGFDGYKR